MTARARTEVEEGEKGGGKKGDSKRLMFSYINITPETKFASLCEDGN